MSKFTAVKTIGALLLAVVLGTPAAHAQSAPAAAGAAAAKAVLSPDEARKVFARMAAQRDISFEYPDDGCYARAHLMSQRMQAMKVVPGKAWAFAQGDEYKKYATLPKALEVKTPNHPAGKVTWTYHVAPTVRVKGSDGVVRTLVIDPAMFSGPVTVGAWVGAMGRDGKRPHVSVTPAGVAPTLPDGRRAPGTGYGPGGDPRDPDAAARKTMAECFAKLRARRGR